MASSRYVRMLEGRQRGQTLEVEGEMADHLISSKQAEEIDFNQPSTSEIRSDVVVPDMPAVTVTAAAPEVPARLKRKR